MRVLRRLTVVGSLVAALLYVWRGVTSTGLPFDPAAADGQVVTLEGTMRRLDAHVSHRGNAYFTFDLDTGTGAVRVFRFGTPECVAGSRAAVAGVFRRVKRVSGYTFYNEVDAERVICR